MILLRINFPSRCDGFLSFLSLSPVRRNINRRLFSPDIAVVLPASLLESLFSSSGFLAQSCTIHLLVQATLSSTRRIHPGETLSNALSYVGYFDRYIAGARNRESDRLSDVGHEAKLLHAVVITSHLL